MCGPSNQMSGDVAQGQSLTNQLHADFSSRFANQSDILGKLTTSLSPLVQNGPNQQGFSGAELAARNSAAINNAGAAARNARMSVGSFAAGQGGGGTSGLTSGITKQLSASVDSAASNSLSANQNQIIGENYATGRQNYQFGVDALKGVGQMEDPSQYSSQTQKGIESNFSMNSKIQEMKNQREMAIASGITGLATSFIPGGQAFGALGKMFGGGGGQSSIGSFAAPGSEDFGQPG